MTAVPLQQRTTSLMSHVSRSFERDIYPQEKRAVLTFFAPPFNATVLFNLRLLEGESPTQSYRSLKRDFLGVWIPSLSVAALLWNSFLSYRTQAASTSALSETVANVIE
uniref:Uncharacterized protein n=1 Tax=Parascaris equorum TaxID=6256 RepID=A0A914RZX6_PAREQ